MQITYKVQSLCIQIHDGFCIDKSFVFSEWPSAVENIIIVNISQKYRDQRV